MAGNSFNLKKCKSAGTYRGIVRPKCNGGIGCDYCWNLFVYETKEAYHNYKLYKIAFHSDR